MSLTSWQPTVKRIKDGEAVDQATVNVTVDQLTQRDQHLYEKFDEMSGKSALISFGKQIFPTETLNPGELNVVYYKGDGGSSGLAKAVTGFSSSTSSSMFTPNNSNYAFGIVKTVYSGNKTADVYTSGLCEFEVDIDDDTLGLLQEDASGNVEPFVVGPYFLSAKSPGKITNAPSGIPVYVGYAISKREFLLHTTVEEFSQFFINYRYHILDRVAGIPVLTSNTWQITAPDITKLGWVPASSSGGIVPPGAVFYYNIPAASLITDTALTAAEKAENLELSKYLPPIPANFVQLYLNGSFLRYKDDYDTGGVYTTNAYGLWWCSAADGTQPWSATYPQDLTGAPSAWNTIKGTIAASRKTLFMSFSRFNPALRTQLVTSLTPHNAGSGSFIKFYDNAQGHQPASPYTGDLRYSIETTVIPTGKSVDDSSFVFPAGLDTAYTKGRAIAALKFDAVTGTFKAAVTPVVAQLNGVGNVRVTEQTAGSGIWNVSYIASGMSGPVDSIEPINARQEFRGLSSYIKLPPYGSTPYGLVGKIILQKGYVNNSDLKIVFHLFGDIDILSTGSTARRVALQFDYSSVSVVNGAHPTANTLVTTLTQPQGINPPVEIDIAAAGTTYSAYTAVKTTATNLMVGSFTVPAVNISEDSIVNFKISRVLPGSLAENDYGGNIGILAAYWEA